MGLIMLYGSPSVVRPSPSLPTEVVCTAKYKAAYPYGFADVQSSPPLTHSFSSDVRPTRQYDTRNYRVNFGRCNLGPEIYTGTVE